MANGAKWVRFVPASGAASRMFAGIREPREAAVEAQLQLEAPRFPFWSIDQKQQVDGFASVRATCASSRVDVGRRDRLEPDCQKG